MRSQRSIYKWSVFTCLKKPGFEDLGLFLTKDVEEGEAFASEIENPSGWPGEQRGRGGPVHGGICKNECLMV